MPRDDTRIWNLFDRAVSHLILAWFGRHSDRARAHLYARSAGFLMAATDLLLELAGEEEQMERGGADGSEGALVSRQAKEPNIVEIRQELCSALSLLDRLEEEEGERCAEGSASATWYNVHARIHSAFDRCRARIRYLDRNYAKRS